MTNDHLEDWNVIVYLGPMPLSHALGDPHDVPALLLFQLQKGVEDAEVELLHEGVHVQLDLWSDEMKCYEREEEVDRLGELFLSPHTQRTCPLGSSLQGWSRRPRSTAYSPK